MEREEIIERMKAARIAKAGRNAARRAFATKTWIAIVGDMINGKLGAFMASTIAKLQRVKFAVNGDMIKLNTRPGKRGNMDRAFEYASRHYPSNIRRWEAAMKEYDAAASSPAEEIQKEGEI